MTDATLRELTSLALRFRDEREWKQFHKFKDMALSMSLESAELLELAQWKNGAELDEFLKTNRHRVGEELSDVLFWVLTIAADQEIDLGDAFRAKLVANAEKYPIEKSRGSSRKYTEL